MNSFEELEYAGDIDNCTYFRPSPPLNIAMAGVKDWHAMLSWRKFVCTTAENQIAERGKEVQELSQQQMQMQMQLQGQQGVVSQHLQIQIAANSHQVCVFLSLSLPFLQAYITLTHSLYHSLTHAITHSLTTYRGRSCSARQTCARGTYTCPPAHHLEPLLCTL